MAKSTTERGKCSDGTVAPDGDAARYRLADLNRRLDRVKARRDKPQPGAPGTRRAAMGMALRLGIELIAGTVIGGLIGWQLDHWLETAPFLLITFFVLGMVAGIVNVIRTAYQMQAWPDDTPPSGPQANDR